MSDPVPEKSAPKRRRWFQFSLGSLLLLMLFAPVAFFAFSEHRERQRLEAELETQNRALSKHIEIQRRADRQLGQLTLMLQAVRQKEQQFHNSPHLLLCEACGDATPNAGSELLNGWSNATRISTGTGADRMRKAIMLCPECAAKPERSVKWFKSLHKITD